MRVVFMGTPQIAVPSLNALAAAHEVVGVFCQPDKPAGRKQTLTPPPVKTAAEALGLRVFQPQTLKTGDAAQQLAALEPDIACVIAYGKILPQPMLDIPKHGCLNAHASLLPKYRGAAPIQRALQNGEAETGVSIMQMDAGMDTGDVLLQQSIEITPQDDAQTLFDSLGALSASMFADALGLVLAGDIAPQKQDDESASYAPPIQKSEALFSWDDAADSIFNKVRAFCLWPTAWFESGEKTVKVFKTARSDLKPGSPGEVLGANPLVVSARGGALELLEVMPQNSKRMAGGAYAAGRRFKLGDSINK